ncbi:MAG TPA: hypothetical protein VEA78_06645 [Acidimicrobiales bacterium]|nr:hypothetical protein [Acidimicrobiales bacterium]
MDLHDQLEHLADGTDVPAGDLDAVIARGRRRQARGKRIVGGLAAVALGSTAVTIIATAGEDDGTNIATTGTTATETVFEWEVVEPDSALALFGRPPTVGGGGVYALSTAPGQAPTETVQPLRVWTSDDGVEWRDLEPPGEDADLYLSDLEASSSDGRIYAIGTGQGSAARLDGRDIPELRVGSSDDGETWDTAALDIDVAAVAEHAQHLSWTQREIATSEEGVVLAMVALRAELDVPELVPDAERWAITPDGVDVLGERTTEPDCGDGEHAGRSDEGVTGPHRVWPDWCSDDTSSREVPPQETHPVERSYTWDELGVEGDLLDAVLARPHVFRSVDGASFDRVDVPIPDGAVSWYALEGGSDGFDLAISQGIGPSSGSTTTLLHSDDGSAWSASPMSSAISWATTMGSVHGQSVVVGSDGGNQPVVVLGDGRVVPLAQEIDPELARDRDAWTAASGVGDLGIAVVVGLSSRESAGADYVLLTSRDGRSWSQQVLADIAGAEVSMVGQPIVTADRIVVPVGLAGERDEDGHLRQLALVGTVSDEPVESSTTTVTPVATEDGATSTTTTVMASTSVPTTSTIPPSTTTTQAIDEDAAA